MAETRAPLSRTLAALPLAAALAGCAATHVGDDWQCPLAQGEVCTSIAAADPAVAPEREPPALATGMPLYRTSGTQAAAPETETGTETRPCAEGCNSFVWLGRLLAPRGAAGETAENAEAVSTAGPDGAPCGGEELAPVDADDGADDTDAPCPIVAGAQATATPAPVAAVEPIAPSVAAVIPCGTDDARAEPPVEADDSADVPAPDDAETPCADPASVDETAVAVDTPPAGDSTSPASATLLAPSTPSPDALRTGEVVGRIWIAPFVDAGGVYREGAWVRAVLAPAGWRR